MKINDASNPQDSLYHDALDMVDADTTTWPFAKFVRSANFAVDAFVRKVVLASGRWQFGDSSHAGLDVWTNDLTAGVADYTIPDKALMVTRLRIKTPEGHMKTLKPVDQRDLTDVVLNATGTPEYYDKTIRSIILHPTPDYSALDGLELTVQHGSNHFDVADTTREPGFDAQFHRYISFYGARDYALKYQPDKLQMYDVELARIERDAQEFYAIRDRDDAPRMTVERSSEIY